MLAPVFTVRVLFTIEFGGIPCMESRDVFICGKNSQTSMKFPSFRPMSIVATVAHLGYCSALVSYTAPAFNLPHLHLPPPLG